MNLFKAQSEIISEIIKRRDTGDRPVMFDEMPGTPYVGVMPSIYYAYVFLEKDFMISTSEMRSTKIMSNVYSDIYRAIPIKWNGKTQTKIKTLKTKSVLAELVNEKNDVTLIDTKYVKKFGKLSDLQLQQRSKNNVVYVNDEKGNLIGYIMPVMNRQYK